jgi:hypothetical protein
VPGDLLEPVVVSSTEAIARGPVDPPEPEDVRPTSMPGADLDRTEPQEAVAAPVRTPRGPPGRAWAGAGLVVLGAFVALCAFAALVPTARAPSPTVADTPRKALSPAPGATGIAGQATESVAAAPAPPPQQEPQTQPQPKTPPEPTSVAIELPLDPARPEPVGALGPPPPHPPRPNCHPPYTIDSEGVRIPKRECLHP